MYHRLVLTRFNYAPEGTFGRLVLPSGETLFTVERPWKQNRVRESCIPEGVYLLEKRYSPVVQRSSGGKYQEGWEIQEVPERDLIMIHPANWPYDVEGCIGVGTQYVIIEDRRGVPTQAVSSSRRAFDTLMTELDQANQWELEIRPYLIEYP